METKDAEKLAKLKEEQKKVNDEIYDFEYSNGMIPDEEEAKYSQYDYEPDGYEEYREELSNVYDGLCSRQETIRKQIFDLEYKELCAKRKEDWEKEKTVFQKGNIANDAITDDELKVDIFNRIKTANNVADIFLKNDLKSPYNIAVLGDWGTGKTTFLNYIKKSITDKNGKKGNVKVVEYNAAEYSSRVLADNNHIEHIEQQWSNLLKTLFEAYEIEHPFLGAIKYNYRRLKYKRSVGRVLLYLLCVLCVTGVVFAFNYFTQKDIKFDSSFWKTNTIGNIALGIVVFAPLVKKALTVSVPLVDRVSGMASMPKYYEELGKREKITFDVKNLLDVWVRKPEERVVILVDDCDRCSKEGIMELFESMHLFLGLEKLFFVFAIDPRLLNSAVALYYGKDGSHALVEQFLQKYVASTVVLNKPDFSNLICNLETIIEPKEELKHCLSDSEYKLCLDIVDSEPNTPRSVKRFINNIISLKDYYMSNELLGEQTEFKHIISWYALNYYHTDVCELLREKISNTYRNYYLKKFSLLHRVFIGDKDFKETPIWKSLSNMYVIEAMMIDLEMGMQISKPPIL